jgi:hypothetical protein
LSVSGVGKAACAIDSSFRTRGYYINLTRLPTFGLKEWKETVDCLKHDGGNTLILWIGGGFRSKKYSITWKFNSEHTNIRRDFVRELIAYSHRRGVKVLLGFTPFGYDGVNQLYLERPHLTATGPDGRRTAKFGIYSWGYNLCPSLPDSQKFMREYANELISDFYPNADGLFIESSDYAVCHCSLCGGKYFEREFGFVRWISDRVWEKNPQATIAVYPHYFSGSKVPFAEARGSSLELDPRWTLVFTPHSAPVEPELMKKAAGSIYSDEGIAWCNVDRVREGALAAKKAGCDGYVPSAECFSYVPTQAEWGEPWIVGKRVVPFGFGWLKEGACPYLELPIRVARLAYREFSRNPGLSREDFLGVLGKELFGNETSSRIVGDALWLTSLFALDRNWSVPPALTAPELVRARKARGAIDDSRIHFYRGKLDELREIAGRNLGARNRNQREVGRIAKWILDQWSNAQGREFHE